MRSGYVHIKVGSLRSLGYVGYDWSSQAFAGLSQYGYYLRFIDTEVSSTDHDDRIYGLSAWLSFSCIVVRSGYVKSESGSLRSLGANNYLWPVSVTPSYKAKASAYNMSFNTNDLGATDHSAKAYGFAVV